MADAYRRYGDSRQPSASLPLHSPTRPRFDYAMPSGHDSISSYDAREDNRGGQRVIGDGPSLNISYDRYIHGAQILYGRESERSMSGGLGGLHHIDDARVRPIGGSDPAVAASNRSMRLGGRSDDLRVLAVGRSDPAVAASSRSVGLGGWSEVPLPPNASSTLFVEGLPANCTCREVAHIFRPFIGYKEVRVVYKESRRSGWDPTVLCFVEFQSPALAAAALDAVQGYQFDERDHDSVHLRLQFARYPVARTGTGHHGKH